MKAIDRLSDKIFATMLYPALVVFGCLAVIEEATADLIEEWKGTD